MKIRNNLPKNHLNNISTSIMIPTKQIFFSLLSSLTFVISHAAVVHGQIVKKLLDNGELISKTVEDVAQTKAEATENVVFMVVVGVVLSVAILAASLYFRRPPQDKS